MTPAIVKDDLLERTRRLADEYSAWNRHDDAGEPGDALIRIFARLAEIVADRINRAPDKNFLAFLELVGVRLLPPQPARVPLTFHLAKGATTEVVVPAGTQVAAVPAEGEKEGPVFETVRDLVATPSLLDRAFVSEPARDRFHDVSQARTAGPSFSPFAGTTRYEHLLYVAHDDFYALETQKDVEIVVGRANADARWLLAIEWSRWDGEAETWVPLTATVALNTNTTVLKDVPVVDAVAVGGRTARFLRGRLATSIERATTELEASGSRRLVHDDLPLDAVFADGERRDVSAPFVPFDRVSPPSTFLLACDAAFSKLGAAVTIAVEVDATTPPAPSPETQLAWEYRARDGTTMSLAAVPDFSDGTNALATSGTIRFTVPGDWAASTEYGETRHWLRVRLVNGGYGEQPPRLARVSVGYRWSIPRLHDLWTRARLVKNDALPALAFTNATRIDLNKDFFPFGLKPALNDTLYLSSDGFAPGSSVTLNVKLTNPSNQSGTPPPAQARSLKLRWEYWDTNQGRWEILGESGPARDTTRTGVTDATNAFTAEGDVRFTTPSTLGQVDVNGEVAYWIRARIAAGDYGAEAQYVADAQAPGGFKLVPASFKPPSISSLVVDYAWNTGYERPTSLVLDNAFETREIAVQRATSTGYFEPFVEAPDDRPALYLGFERPFSDVSVALYFGAAEARYRAGAAQRADDAEPPAIAWEYWDGVARAWSPLEVRDESRGFVRRGLVTFVAPSRLGSLRRFGADRHWLRAVWTSGEYTVAPMLERVLTNTTWAENATTVRAEVVGSAGTEAGQIVRTSRAPVLPGQRVDVRESEPPPADERAVIVEEEGDEAVRVVEDETGRPREVWVRWHEVLDFHGSGPRSRHYVLDRMAGEIRFGDGRRGMIPPAGAGNLVASYRTGGGVRGNRAAGAVSQLKTTIPYVDRADNPEPAAGGAEAESLDAARVRGPRTLRHGGRAVTISDFEDLAWQASGAVARVRGVPVLSDRDAGRVGLVVVPKGDEPQPIPSVELIARVREYVEARATPTFDLWVGGPGWLRVSVTAEVVPRTLEHAADVESAVRARLARFLHPLHGGLAGTGWPFGRRPHRSDLHALIEATPGVDYVRALDVREELVEASPLPDAYLAFSGAHEISMAGGGE